jgi:hypothetical protein
MCFELTELTRSWAAKIPEIRAIILYGSRAREEHKPDSDWDVCVLLETSNSKNGEWYGTWVACADNWHESFCNATGLEKSKVQFTAPTSNAVRKGIERSSKFLYLKDEIKKINT